MTSGGLGECRDCAEPVRFVLLPSGKHIAVQTAPHPTGSVAVIGAARGVLHGHVISTDRPHDGVSPRYVVHAARCDARPAPPQPVPDPQTALF